MVESVGTCFAVLYSKGHITEITHTKENNTLSKQSRKYVEFKDQLWEVQ